MTYPIILNFTITKGPVIGVTFVRHISYLTTWFSGSRFSLVVLHFCLEKSAIDDFIHLSLPLRILESLCRNRPLNIGIIAEAKNI